MKKTFDTMIELWSNPAMKPSDKNENDGTGK